MIKKDGIYIKHIRDAIQLILEYTNNLDYDKFIQSNIIQDAVIRRIEIIGEATKNISIKLRDKLMHGYFGTDIEKIWNVIDKDIPLLQKQIEEIIKSEKII